MCQDIYVSHCPEWEDEGEEKDFLVDCRGIILAYAGKQLLKPTNLQLLRNHRCLPLHPGVELRGNIQSTVRKCYLIQVSFQEISTLGMCHLP